MQHNFGVIVPGTFIASGGGNSAIVRISGSLPELGSWSVKDAPALTCHSTDIPSEVNLVQLPRFYQLEIKLSGDIKEFQYRYIINDDIHEKEEDGPRKWTRDNEKYLIDNVYYTPVDNWTESKATINDEQFHTYRYYREILEHKMMHCSKVSEQLYIGTGPRLPSHITKDLRENLGITAVVNVQVLEDIEKYYPKILGLPEAKEDRPPFTLDHVDQLEKIYEKEGMLMIWIPVYEYSTLGRELLVPSATHVLKGLLEKGHRVYVHCNGGVGRSFGLICAYYAFVKKVPLPVLHYQMASARAAGYFDQKFLEKGLDIYKKAFE